MITENSVTKQHIKQIFVQLLAGVLTVLIYGFLVEFGAMKALLFSFFVGLVYSLLLFLGIFSANRLSRTNPKYSMAILTAFAGIRFIVVGALFVVAFSNWADYPVPLMLPFFLMLIAPAFLLPFKKRISD